MTIPVWIIALFGVVLAGLCAVCYHLLVQNGRMVLRLEALESARDYVRMSTPEGHPLWRFTTGGKWDIDNVWGPIFIQDEYRMREVHLGPEDVVIDVGAHIGVFSYLSYIRGSRAIYSYEASERNFQLLKLNLEKLPGTHLFHRAVWRSDQPCEELLVSGTAGENTGIVSALAAGSVIDFYQQSVSASDGPRMVPAIALDEILAGFPRVRLLKLDCEGSEFPILFTSRELHRVQTIIAEVHDMSEQVMARLEPRAKVEGFAAYTIAELVRFLESQGFRVNVREGVKNHYNLDARLAA